MNPLLTVVPMGGLCNRLRTTLSARFVSETLGRPVRVEWGRDPECGAAFDELFLPMDGDAFRIVRRSWWNRPAVRRELYWPAMVRLFCYGEQQREYHPARHGEVKRFVRNHSRVYFSTGYALSDYPVALTRLLCPRPEIHERIEIVTRQFPAVTVGIHIRRTDNEKSVHGSPVSAFCRRMEEEIRTNPDVRFFLATDDDALRRDLCADYPVHLLPRQERPVRRDTLEGVRDAVADLWCLAATRRIYGSYWSSFTDMAAEIGRVPLTIVREGNDSP